jgi:hypothetical protein
MDPEELARVEASLHELLADAGLSWIAEQVEGAVREEQPVVAHVEPASVGYVAWEFADGLSSSSAATSSHYTTEPYSPTERVLLLIGAIRRALVDATQVDLLSFHSWGDARCAVKPQVTALRSCHPDSENSNNGFWVLV